VLSALPVLRRATTNGRTRAGLFALAGVASDPMRMEAPPQKSEAPPKAMEAPPSEISLPNEGNPR